MGPESWVISSVVSSPFHHAQLNNLNNSTAGLRIMLPFIVIGVKRHNCPGVNSRFSQELKKDALYLAPQSELILYFFLVEIHCHSPK